MKKGLILLLLWLTCIPFNGNAQEVVMEATETIEETTDIMTEQADSTVMAVVAAADSIQVPAINIKPVFKPNPTKATLYALIPGMGQVYNRKYWKLPFVYGGLMGCMYAITWNNRNYTDYKDAFFDLMSSDPVKNDSWRDFIREPNLSEEQQNEKYINNTNFEQELKRKKDYFRKYRDLSIIMTVGIYAITIIDAYVDAQLFDFDITPDLSMRVEPTYTPKTSFSSSTYGLNCSFRF